MSFLGAAVVNYRTQKLVFFVHFLGQAIQDMFLANFALNIDVKLIKRMKIIYLEFAHCGNQEHL